MAGESRRTSVAKALAVACAEAQWWDDETGECSTWEHFLPVVAAPVREAQHWAQALESALKALEAWALWWNGLPLDEQVRDHDAAHRAISITRAALAKAKARPARGEEVAK